MKNISYFYTPALLFVLFLTSCNKDEVVPPLAVEGLSAFSGKNRAMVQFNPREGAVKGKVFYNSGDYKEFDITESPQSVIVEGLPEQEHILRVVGISAEGVVSDPKAVSVTVYGDSYENTLRPRKWTDQVMRSPNAIELHFAEAFSQETAVRLVYVTTSGTKDSVDISAGENTMLVEDINTEEDYFYYSLYKPEASAIDNFFSNSLSVKTAMMMDFQKDKWLIEGSSGEDNANAAANIIDDDGNTSWRTQEGGAYPHWVSVDMGSPKVIDGFYYNKTRQRNEDDPKALKIEVSNDKLEWTTVLETEVSGSFLQQELALDETVTAQYFKITVNSTIDPAASQVGFAEIDAYNTLNQSGDSGYTPGAPVELLNATAPFTGDGSDLAPPLAGRMQQLVEWTHNGSNISYDNNVTDAMTLFAVPVWGAPALSNGKVYQTVTLEPGHYLLQIESAAAQGPAEIYGVAALGASLPDFTAIPTSLNSAQYVNLMDHQDGIAELLLMITEESPVAIGVVYNLPDQYASTGIPWTSFTIKGFDLRSVE